MRVSDEFKVGVRAMLKLVAERVVPDPDCGRCRRFAWDAEEEGCIPLAESPGKIRPCASCSARRPYAWVAGIDPKKFVEWAEARDPNEGAFLIDELKVLLPEPRGSSRFEFL